MENLHKISICIPTYNRHVYLERCLNSIKLAYSFYSYQVEICIYDSSETNESKQICDEYSKFFNIKYLHNPNNEGYAGNFKNCVSMAKSRMIWLIGDDDVVVQSCFKVIDDLFTKFPTIDFFYCNAYQLDEKFFKDFQKPFDTKYLPKDMKKLTSISNSKLTPFQDLVDYKLSFDFLGGMFLSIFNRQMWESNKSCIKEDSSRSQIKFSDLDSTFPHSKIFARAFMRSDAYLLSEPLVVAVSGVREWVEFYPFIRTFRLMDLLMEYKQNGLPYFIYWKNKNFTVKYFAYDALYSLKNRNSRFPRIRLLKYIVSASDCPNFYLSFIRLMLSPLKRIIK